MPKQNAQTATPGLPVAFSRAREAIGFLERHRLEPNPLFYTLAFSYVSEPGSPLARGVDDLTDGGVRLDATSANDLASKLVPDAASHMRADVVSHANRLTRSAFDTLSIASDLGKGVAPHVDKTSPIADIAKAILDRALAAEADLQASIDELARTREALQLARVDADHDPLTGLLNRRGLEPLLADLDRVGGYAVAMCDIDRFKSINDTYGHPTGDNVLHAVAKSIVDSCPDATVGRWGGEEILVVAQRMDIRSMHAMIDTARRAMEARSFRLRQSGELIGPITFSAGCAIAQDDGIVGAIERADVLCYVAKTDGRNLVRSQGA